MSMADRPKRFIGSFCHSLDAKGRLVIPQNFREKLGDRFCVAPSYDFKSIAVYPTEMWEKRETQPGAEPLPGAVLRTEL